jgi:hypothetical protein
MAHKITGKYELTKFSELFLLLTNPCFLSNFAANAAYFE